MYENIHAVRMSAFFLRVFTKKNHKTNKFLFNVLSILLSLSYFSWNIFFRSSVGFLVFFIFTFFRFSVCWLHYINVNRGCECKLSILFGNFSLRTSFLVILAQHVSLFHMRNTRYNTVFVSTRICYRTHLQIISMLLTFVNSYYLIGGPAGPCFFLSYKTWIMDLKLMIFFSTLLHHNGCVFDCCLLLFV